MTPQQQATTSPTITTPATPIPVTTTAQPAQTQIQQTVSPLTVPVSQVAPATQNTPNNIAQIPNTSLAQQLTQKSLNYQGVTNNSLPQNTNNGPIKPKVIVFDSDSHIPTIPNILHKSIISRSLIMPSTQSYNYLPIQSEVELQRSSSHMKNCKLRIISACKTYCLNKFSSTVSICIKKAEVIVKNAQVSEKKIYNNLCVCKPNDNYEIGNDDDVTDVDDENGVINTIIGNKLK